MTNQEYIKYINPKLPYDITHTRPNCLFIKTRVLSHKSIIRMESVDNTFNKAVELISSRKVNKTVLQHL